jgi:tight adherence protein B
MEEILVLALVFAAVAWGAWVLTPLIAQVGVSRGIGSYTEGSGPMSPMRRFTTPERLAQACWSTGLLGGGVAGSILISFNLLSPTLLGSVCIVSGVLAFQIPKVWLRGKIRKRLQAFEARLMDLTLGLANGLRAGSALPQSLELVTRDIGGPMQEEFALLLHEYRLGIDLAESFRRLCVRMPGEDLYLLTTSISLTMQSGGSLAEVLERITDTIRNRTEFYQKLRTMTAQGRFEAIAMAAAPLLAFGILFYLDPALMKPLVQTRMGWTAIGIVLVLETVGFLVINKIVTIKV